MLDAGCRMLQIERVLCIARGVVGGRVQGVEAVILVLDLRAVCDYEPDLAETADNVLGHLRERMELADEAAAPGQSEIRGFLGQGSFEFELAAALGDRKSTRLNSSHLGISYA